MRGGGLSSVASSVWHWARGPYLIGATELSPCLVQGPQGDFRCYSGRIYVREWLESLHHYHLDVELLQPGSKLNKQIKKAGAKGFPGGTVVGNPPAGAGDTGSSPGPGRSHMLWSN